MDSTQVPPVDNQTVLTPADSDTLAPSTAAVDAVVQSSDPYVAICSQIVREQSQIIGDLASEQANLVPGLQVDPSSFSCTITGDGATILEQLVIRYRSFFGAAAVQVCRDVVSRHIHQLPNGIMPSVLQ